MASQNTTDNKIWAVAFLIIGCALAVQFLGYINLDNAWLLHVAERVVGGEKLGRQVVESNPPLIVYLMEIPVYISRYLYVNSVHAFSAFIGLLALISLILSFSQIKDANIKLCLTFALIFMPAWAYGEREHIFIILILPYFVSMWRTEKPGIAFLVISGFMAGIGFSLKPFFLLTWAVMAITKMCIDRRFWNFINIQNIIIGLIIAGYLAYLIFIEKTYINDVLPLLIKYYGSYNSEPSEVYKQSLELAFLCQIAFWIVYIKDRNLLTRPIYFCSFANLASVLLIVIQGKVWLNYFYPPNFFGFMANAMLTIVLFEKLDPLWNKVASFISNFILMIFVTLSISMSMRMAFHIKEEETDKEIAMIEKYAHGKRVYALTFDLGVLYPALLYTHSDYRGHYGHFWMIPGIYEKYENAKNGDELIFREEGQRADDETKTIGIIVSDFVKNPPELVFVMNSRYYSRKMGDYSFDFIKYFSGEPVFAEIWKNYKKVGNVGNKDVYLYSPENNSQ